MRELVPLTNAVAAKMLASALSGCGGFEAILATQAAAVKPQGAPAAKSAAEAKVASPASDRSREHHSAPRLLAAV